jgi:hypothetical protein
MDVLRKAKQSKKKKKKKKAAMIQHTEFLRHRFY